MPRRLREDYAGAWHHVMNRGVARAEIFRTDDDRCLFLRYLEQAASRAALDIHGYCLLGNHYHLLLLSREGRLSEGMQWLASRYTQHLNYAHGRDGPIFKGRFQSIEIEDDAHLARVSRYIHLNPVEAGLAPRAELWPWSSAAAYLSGASAPVWLKTSTILDMFGPTSGQSNYFSFVSAGVDGQTAGVYGKLLG